MKEEILKTVRERGLLVGREVLDLVESFGSSVRAKEFLENLERYSGQKMINKRVLSQNFEFVKSFVNRLGENKNEVEKVIVRLGLSLQIESHKPAIRSEEKEKKDPHYKVFYADTNSDRKIEVSDFVGNFRTRYQEIQRLLMHRPELQNLVSIGKISGERQSLSLIGMVSEKRITKNKNLIIKFEDLTGEVNALVKADREEIFDKAQELLLDDIVAVKASGSREMIFVHDIIFPDAFLPEKVKFDEDISVAFLSDIHCGSNGHLEKSFERFLEWIKSEDEVAKKIKYLFFVGDNVDGVGIFPGQEKFLKLTSMKEQYTQLAGYLRRIPKRITMFMCPGQHDASRVAEPQPIISREYASELYEIENLVMVSNPSLIKLIEGEKEFKVQMYHGASIHGFINEIKELREAKAHTCPARAVKHMLKRRHFASSHGSAGVVYIPNKERDPLVIREVPDVLCTGEVHRLDIENHNGVLIITGSCWQDQTDFEEKIGNIPDPAKVPVLNLKTRELKVYDFSVAEEIKGARAG